MGWAGWAGSGGGGGGGAVDSVNGQTGVVVLDATDVGADESGAATTAQTNAEAYTDTQIGDIPSDGAAGIASLRTLGTTATSACAGDDSRLSDARTPIMTPFNSTGSSTLSSASVNHLLLANSTSDITYTLPATGIAVGSQIYVQRIGTGNVLFAAQAGASIDASALSIAAQYQGAVIICTATGVYSIIGALS